MTEFQWMVLVWTVAIELTIEVYWAVWKDVEDAQAESALRQAEEARHD